MNSKELRSIKDGFFTGLTLLGFKPIKSLKLHLYLSPASFIYPDENLIKGKLLRIDSKEPKGLQKELNFKKNQIKHKHNSILIFFYKYGCFA